MMSADYPRPAEETARPGYDRGVLRQEEESCVRYYGARPL
jgi:hypothetical protein